MAKPVRKKTVSVDFEGVEAGGRKVPDGDYQAEVHDIEHKESSQGNPMFVVQWKITSEQCKGAVVYDNVSLLPQSLWRFRGMLEALGEEVPDGTMEIDPDDLLEKECFIEITNENYEGKDRPKVTGFLSLEDKPQEATDETEQEAETEAEEAEEETQPAKKTGARKVEKPDARVGKPKWKLGQKVTFTDDDNKTHKGTITELDDDDAKVEDPKGDEWQIPLSELKAA